MTAADASACQCVILDLERLQHSASIRRLWGLLPADQHCDVKGLLRLVGPFCFLVTLHYIS
jgi:hypothetical protein